MSGTVPARRPDYGLDAPPVVYAYAAVGAGGAVALAAGSVSGITGLVGFGVPALVIGGGTAAAMVFSSYVGKIRLRDRLLDGLGLRGDENVLDLGCGRGLMLLGAALRLPSGSATGIDLWRGVDQRGSSRENCLENARRLGVADRVSLVDGDISELPFPDGSFDLVTASLAIHNIHDRARRARAIAEAARVLRPGGRLLIMDIAKTAEYVADAQAAGLRDVRRSGLRFSIYPPVRVVTATKPA